MSEIGELVVGAAVVFGLAGIVFPLLPGLWVVGAAVAVWGAYVGGAWGWAIAIFAILMTLVGTVVKFLIPGRRLKREDIPTRTIVIGAALGIVGFFLIPVIGGPIGFVFGIYLAQRQRVGEANAWASTKVAAIAVGLSIGIELMAGLLIAGAWIVGLIAT